MNNISSPARKASSRLNEQSAENSICFSNLEPSLASLGEMIGLLRAGEAEQYCINRDWFSNPIGMTGDGVKNHADKLARLLGQLLGQVGGQALGVPLADPALVGEWYPITIPGSEKPSGLYVGSYARDGEQVLGLSVYHDWEVPASSPLLRVSSWAMAPLLRLGHGQIKPAMAEPGYPITLGVAAEGIGGKPLVSINGFAFDGVKFSAEIDVAAAVSGKKAVEFSIVVLQLLLPGETAPRDRSLADLESVSAAEILNTASALFIAALSNLSADAAERAKFLLPGFGLSTIVPDTDSRLPILGWDELLRIAVAHGDLSEPFSDWFRAITSNPDLLKTWLSTVGGVLGHGGTVTGEGTRADPFLVTLIDLSKTSPAIGVLSFSAASVVDAVSAQRVFYPGLQFRSAPIVLGESNAAVSLVAKLELAQFVLGAADARAAMRATSLHFEVGIRLANKDASKPLASGGGFEFGALETGLALGTELRPVPTFQMVRVQTPEGAYPDINLLSPGELAKAAENLLLPAIEQALKALLGLDPEKPIPFVENTAVLLGIIAPKLPAGAQWPVAPPFAIAQLAATIRDPVAALAGYYHAAIASTAKIDGQQPFYYIIRELAGLFQSAGLSGLEIHGSGTRAEPWRATVSLTDVTLPAALTAFIENTAERAELTLGLELGPELIFGDTKIVPSLGIEFLRLELPAPGAQGTVQATWGSEIHTQLALPNGFDSRGFAGVEVKLGPSSISAGWGRAAGWHWSLLVGKPTVVINGHAIQLDRDLNFNDQSSLQGLVSDEVPAFIQMLAGVLGLAMLEMNTRIGLAVTGALGLVKDLKGAPNFPPGLTWPDIPLLQLATLSNPLPALRNQIAKDLEKPEFARAVLSLMAWAASSAVDAPGVRGDGTFQNPYAVPLPAGFELPVWYQADHRVAGFGIGRSHETTFDNGYRIAWTARLSAIEVSLETGQIQAAGQAPSLSLLCTVDKPGGMLVPGSEATGKLGALRFGFTANIAGGIAVHPCVDLLNVTLPGGTETPVLTIGDYQTLSDRAGTAFQLLFHAALQLAIEQVKKAPLFESAYALLTELGLALPRAAADDPYGVNASGWLALLADPTGFAKRQLSALLLDPALRAALFAYLENLLQIELPEIPVPALEVLSALGFVGDAAHGYPLRPDALLAAAQRPFQSITQAFQKLIDNPAELLRLAGQLAGNIVPPDFGPFSFASTGGTEILLSIKPAHAVKLAGVVAFSGELALDLANRAVNVAARLYILALDLAVEPKLRFRPDIAATPEFRVAVVWGDGSRPASPSITLYPFESSQFVDQLAKVAPAYALSTLAGLALKSEIVAKYPLAQQIFSGLGLAKAIPADGATGALTTTWSIPSLLGILYDPKGWLLSDGVLGKKGRFSIEALGELLSKLPAVSSSNGISVAPTAGGVRISGLPYGFAVKITATGEQANLEISASGISIANGNGTLDKLAVAVGISMEAQASVSGTVVVATSALLSSPFFVEAGYDRQFLLTVAQGKPGTIAGLSLQILPFLGLGSLVQQLAKVPALLVRDLTPILLEELKKTGAKDFAEALQTAGTQLGVAKLLDAVIALPLPLTLEAVERVALDWLRSLLSPEGAAGAAEAVATLLKLAFPTQVSAKGGLVAFSGGSLLPITLLAGVEQVNGTTLAGVWAELEFPQLALLQSKVRRTGVGVPVSGAIQPVFQFGVVITAPIDQSVGPQLRLEYLPKGFTLAFDPLGDAADVEHSSDLKRELLPDFFPDPHSTASLRERVTEWITASLTTVLPRYVAALILNQENVLSWLDAGIVSQEGAPTPGQILVASSLLTKKDNRYSLVPIETLKRLDIQTFLGNFLRTLLSVQLHVLKFGTPESGIWIGPNPNKKDSFGLLLAAPDLAVPKISNVILQLGGTNDEWIAKSGGDIGKLKPGLSAYVPLNPDTFKPDFTNVDINLVNVGFDFQGRGSKPLVDTARFQLGQAQLRSLVTVALNGGSPAVNFGAYAGLKEIAISLAPNTLVPGSGGNPVAKSLLGSGTEEKTENPPVNPTFSVEAAYTKEIWVNLSSNTSEGSEVVVPVQRTFGPLQVGSVGLGWVQESKLLQVLFTGSVELAGLRADVDRLRVGIPVTTLADIESYRLDVAGLNVSFQGGPVVISGGLLKTTNPLSYTGAVLVKAAQFSIAAIGSYAEVADEHGKKSPSLFVFGALRAPLGGPPAFFITGLAAGFSYNRDLLLPSVGEVQNFPLVSGVVNGKFTEGEKPETALAELNRVVAPKVGAYWVAAGITFTSFQVLDALALVFLKFGRDWEIALLGLVSAPLPKGLPKGRALAYIELGIKVSIRPVEGVISVEAQLTPNSYVIAQQCKLTGGFAFYLWFKEIRRPEYTIPAGSFVTTLGGYHPAFVAPKYYPAVPRLGFAWLIEVSAGSVNIGGGAYFALVPTAVMAGGYLQVSFKAGPLHAWLNASANFLIEWAPFYFRVDIQVSIGVALKTTVFGISIALSVEIGADLTLEGPPSHGWARINWYIVSFTIPIGDQPTATNPNNLDWPQFAATFLPPPVSPETPKPARRVELRPRAGTLARGAEPAQAAGSEQQVIKLSVGTGLLQQTSDRMLLRPVPFQLQVASAIPTSMVTVSASSTAIPGVPAGVRPMGVITLRSPLTITLRGPSGNVDLKARGVALDGARDGAPSALWSKDSLDREHPPDAKKMIIAGALIGLELNAADYVRVSPIEQFPIKNLAFTPGDPIQLPFAVAPVYAPAGRFDKAQQDRALTILKNNITQPQVIARRKALWTALQASRLGALANPELSVMASAAELILQQRPVLARPGVYQTNAPPAAGRVVRQRSHQDAALPKKEPMAPELIGGIRRYAVSVASASPVSGLLSRSMRLSGQWMEGSDRVAAGPRALASFLRPDMREMVLYPGALALWKIDPAAIHRVLVEGEGETGARIICFDAHQELQSDAVARGSHTLPAGCASFAVLGSEPRASALLGGWQIDITLLRLNLYYAAGEGCTVRTQNLLRKRSRGRAAVRGIASARELVANNLVETVGGVLRPGWIETIFAAGGRSFAVAVETSRKMRADVRVTAARGHRPEPVSQDALTPEVTVASDEVTILFFRAPDASGGEYLNVIAQPRSAGTSVVGVYLLEAEPGSAAEQWRALKMRQSAVELDGTVAEPARVTVMAGAAEGEPT